MPDKSREKKFMPRFSVITVCLNSEKTIGACVNSLIRQTYTNFEYIVIDGMSSDSTLEIIKNSKIRATIVSEPDSGLYDAMNKAINLSSGEYIYFLNSDDVFYADTVLEDVASNIMGGSADIYYGNILIKHSDGVSSFFVPPNEVNLVGALSIYCLPHQAMFASRNSFQIIGKFSLNNKILDDYEWYVHGCALGLNFKYINVNVAEFSFDGLSSNGKKRLEEFYRIQNNSKLFVGGDFDISRLINSIDHISSLKTENCRSKLYKQYSPYNLQAALLRAQEEISNYSESL